MTFNPTAYDIVKPHILLQIIWYGKPMKRIMGGFFCILFCGIMLSVSVLDAAAESLEQTFDTQVYRKQMVTCEAEKDALEAEFGKTLYAASAVLMDADSGRVLYGKNEEAPMAMASTTKIMTCIVLLEQGNLEDVVQVSSYAASMPKVKLYIKKGETYQVKDLLYSLMLESHNDSAVALAEYLGSRYLPENLKEKEISEHTAEESRQAVAAFAVLMNRKAQELGCEDTYFITPNGLDATETITGADETIQKEHHTTAEELAKIMSYCITGSEKKEDFLNITRTGSYAFSANGRSFSCNNHNAFLSMMDGALSGKTGFTNKAGYCYVGALRRDGRTFVVALLACGWPNHKTYKWSDTRELMQYAVDNFFYRDFMSEEVAFNEEELKDLPVKNGRTEILGDTAYVNLGIAERTGEDSGNVHGLLMRPDEKVAVECRMHKSLQAPVRKGTPVGNIYYVVDDTIYRKETIVAEQDIEKIDFSWCLEQVFWRFRLG